MESIRKNLRKDWYKFCIISILFLAIFLRFYNYSDRWGLAYDQAHDALVARYALSSFNLPLLGPFSSAGAFQTGGEWYWIIMLGTFIYPYWVLTPWVFLTMIYVFFVFCMIRFGSEFIDKQFGIVVGLLATVSTAQISQAVNLTNQSPLAIISLFAIWAMVRYVRTKKEHYLFYLSIMIGLGSSIHLQGVALVGLLLAIILYTGVPSIRGISLGILGLFIPWMPVFISDMQNNFVNTSNMIVYYARDQYNISLDVLGRRWLTYAGLFWPKAWAHVIGGSIVLGYLLPVCVAATTVHGYFKKTLTKEWYILLTTFFLAVVLIRYTRTPIFDSYLVFLHPFIILFTGLVIISLSKYKKVISIVLLLFIVIGSIIKDIPHLKGSYNYTPFVANQWSRMLEEKIPNMKFAIYDLKYGNIDKSLPLVLYLDAQKKIDDNGIKLGVFIATSGSEMKHEVLIGERGGYQIVNLNSSSSAELEAEGWAFVNPSIIYSSTEEWYKNK